MIDLGKSYWMHVLVLKLVLLTKCLSNSASKRPIFKFCLTAHTSTCGFSSKMTFDMSNFEDFEDFDCSQNSDLSMSSDTACQELLNIKLCSLSKFASKPVTEVWFKHIIGKALSRTTGFWETIIIPQAMATQNWPITTHKLCAECRSFETRGFSCSGYSYHCLPEDLGDCRIHGK